MSSYIAGLQRQRRYEDRRWRIEQYQTDRMYATAEAWLTAHPDAVLPDGIADEDIAAWACRQADNERWDRQAQRLADVCQHCDRAPATGTRTASEASDEHRRCTPCGLMTDSACSEWVPDPQ